MRTTAYLFLFMLALGNNANAQTPLPTIHLRGGDLAISQPSVTSVVPGNSLFRETTFEGNAYLLIQFKKLPSASNKNLMEREGVRLLEYIPDNTFIVQVSKPVSQSRLQQFDVLNTLVIQPVYKTDPLLSNLAAGQRTAEVIISAYPGINSKTLISELGRLGIIAEEYKPGWEGIVRASIASEQISLVARQPFVYYLEEYEGDPKPFNQESGILHGTNFLNDINGRNLTGKNVVVGIGDNGLFESHIDLAHKTIGAPGFQQPHATHVAGILGGSGLRNPRMKGKAPDALLIGGIFDVILVNTPLYYQQYGMVLTNNSYGSSTSCRNFAVYTSSSKYVDEQLLNYPQVMHVFASGNQSATTCDALPVSYGTLSGGFQSAKNPITVGGGNKFEKENYYSKGPTRDGRIKPEITAIGRNVFSTVPGNTYSFNYGTSMSCPQVTGAMALLVERYRQLNNNANPRGALLKNIVCNATDEAGNSGPDFANGYGYLNALRAIEMIEGKNYHLGTIENNQQQTISLTAGNDLQEIKIMLYWPDRPASLYASRFLVNDLDIKVTAPNGTEYQPLVLPANGSVTATAVAGEDHINNMEQVIIRNPLPGNYTISVKGYAIAFGPQEYSLTYNMVKKGIRLIAPFRKEQWKSNETQVISWIEPESSPANYRVEFSPDGGGTWQTVSMPTGSVKQLSFIVPSVITVDARIRVTNLLTSQSATVDSLIVLPELVFDASSPCLGVAQVNCPLPPEIDSFTIVQISHGEIWGRYTTTTTSTFFKDLNPDSVYLFAVHPWKQGIAGERTVATIVQPLGGYCHLPEYNGDIKLTAFNAPGSGRMLTSSARTNTEKIRISITNIDDNDCITPFVLKLFVNGVLLQRDTVTATIAGLGTYAHVFDSSIDLSSPGIFKMEVIAEKANDPNLTNNKIQQEVRIIDNPLVTIPFQENFESLTDTVYEFPSYTGMDGAMAWDFLTDNITGKLRTKISANNKGLGLGRGSHPYLPTAKHTVTATYNMQQYDSSDNIFFSFNTQNDMVVADGYVRGADTGTWIHMSAYDVAAKKANRHRNITRILKKAGQVYTHSFQVKFETTNSIGIEGNPIMYIDDVEFYKISKDAAVDYLGFVSGTTVYPTDTIQLKLAALNNVSTPLTDAILKIRSKSGRIVQYPLPQLDGHDSVQVVLALPPLPGTVPGPDSLFISIEAPGDEYADNNTYNLVLTVQPVISAFPFLDGLEKSPPIWTAGAFSLIDNHGWIETYPKRAANGNRYWYMMNSEQIPANPFIGNIASPGIDLSKMKNPHLSFSGMRHLRPGRDSAWVQISFNNGRTFQKLNSTENLNWYNFKNNTLWSDSDKVYWHAITTRLPDTNKRIVQLRVFINRSDSNRLPVWMGSIGVDDLHVYDLIYPIANTAGQASGDIKVKTGWQNMLAGDQIAGAVDLQGQDPGTLSWQFLNSDKQPRIFNGNKILSRKWILKTTRQIHDAVLLRLYFTDEEAEILRKLNACTQCADTVSAYHFGVYRYKGPPVLYSPLRSDNVGTDYEFMNAAQFDLIPYDKGYYAELKVRPNGEFYIYLPERTAIEAAQWNAAKVGEKVVLNWQITNETAIAKYEIERASGKDDFESGVYSVIETRQPGSGPAYSYTDASARGNTTYYYRLKQTDKNGYIHYSEDRSVTFGDGDQIFVYPNPSLTGLFHMVVPQSVNNTFTWQLSNSIGQILQGRSVSNNGQAYLLTIDLSSKAYASGVYLLKIQYGGETTVLRLVKG